jgi:hypothetical protein
MELKLLKLRRWLFALCQARSGQCLKQPGHRRTCGSGLAREGASTFDIDVD